MPTITINSSVGGDSTASYEGTSGTSLTVPAGGNVAINARESYGYTFVSLNPSPSNLSLTLFNVDNGVYYYTFTMPSTNVTFSPTFNPINASITKVVSPAGAGIIYCPSSVSVGDQVHISQTPASGYTFSHWNIMPDNGSSGWDDPDSTTYFYYVGDPVTITAYYTANPVHTLTWTNGALAVTQSTNSRVVSATMSGSATDSYNEPVIYWLKKGSEKVARFVNGQATYVLREEDNGVSVTYSLYAESSIEALGATATLTASCTDFTNAGYYDGTDFLECVPYYYNGTAWIECDWQYYNGTSWLEAKSQ